MTLPSLAEAPTPFTAAKTGATTAATATDDLSVSHLLGAAASNLGAAVKSHFHTSLAALRSPARTAADLEKRKSPAGRRLAHLRSPLVGVVVVAMGVCGLVYWHGLTGSTDATRAVSTPSSPKIVPTTTASAQPVVVSVEPTPSPAYKPEPAATETPALSTSQPHAALETPVVEPVSPDLRPDDPVAKKPDDAPSPADGLASLDGSPAGTAGLASPTPASNDAHDKTQNDSASTPAKSQAGTGRSSHSHHGSRSAPTPTPSFFQKLFGIKPKPKSK